MLAREEGEGVLFILQVMCFYWPPEGEGELQVDIAVWMVKREQMAPVVWGKFHPKFGMEVLGGSQVNATMQALVTMGE